MKGLNKLRNILYSWIGRLNIKIFIPLTLTYIHNSNQDFKQLYFQNLINSKFYTEIVKNRIAKIIWKKNKAGKITLPTFNTKHRQNNHDSVVLQSRQSNETEQQVQNQIHTFTVSSFSTKASAIVFSTNHAKTIRIS